jgi:hypothetical protein
VRLSPPRATVLRLLAGRHGVALIDAEAAADGNELDDAGAERRFNRYLSETGVNAIRVQLGWALFEIAPSRFGFVFEGKDTWARE